MRVPNPKHGELPATWERRVAKGLRDAGEAPGSAGGSIAREDGSAVGGGSLRFLAWAIGWLPFQTQKLTSGRTSRKRTRASGLSRSRASTSRIFGPLAHVCTLSLRPQIRCDLSRASSRDAAFEGEALVAVAVLESRFLGCGRDRRRERPRMEQPTMVAYRTAERGDAEAIAALHARSWREHDRGSFTDTFLDGNLPDERRWVWGGRGWPGLPGTSSCVWPGRRGSWWASCASTGRRALQRFGNNRADPLVAARREV